MRADSSPDCRSPSSSAPPHRAAPLYRVCAFALLYTAAVIVLRVAVHVAESPFRADVWYRLGVLAGSGTQLLLGVAAGSALWFRSSRAAIMASSAIAGGLLAAHAAAAHYHATFHRLPSERALSVLEHSVFERGSALAESVAAHAPFWLVAAEAGVLAAAVGLSTSRFAGYLRMRFGQRARSVYQAVGAAFVLLIGIAIATTTKGTGQLYFGAADPIIHLAFHGHQPNLPSPRYAPRAEVMRFLQTELGVEAPTPIADPRFPYCRDEIASRDGSSNDEPRDMRGRRQSIVMLILESVGARELQLKHQGQPLMPNLARMAMEGVSFQRFFASGDRSAQALVSMFSGIPPATYRRILAHAPLAPLPGVARDLKKAGFETRYYHGSDLSFEQQRMYLRRAGFDAIVEPHPAEERIGWGLPDGTMFQRMQSDLEQRSREQPHFSVLFTLSTHDPYAIPDDFVAPVTQSDRWSRFASSLAYLDHELGLFYEWFLRHEAPSGALLIVVGDHTPRLPHPTDPTSTTTGEFEYRFRVPLILLGLKPETLARARQRTRVTSGHVDLPQTILGLARVARRGCYQGRNLLGRTPWPKARKVVSLAGEELEFMYVHEQSQRWMFHLKTQVARLYDIERDPNLKRDLYRPQHEQSIRLGNLVRAYHEVGRYLSEHARYAPSHDALRQRQNAGMKPASKGQSEERLRLVSHRGNTIDNQEHSSAKENTLDAIAAAIEAGFEWVEVDVQVTRDGVPVLAHDAAVHVALSSNRAPAAKDIAALEYAELERLGDARPPSLEEALTRFGTRVGFCLELKPQRDVFRQMDLVHGVVRLLDTIPHQPVMVDSFARTMLTSMREFSDVEIGYDLPQQPVEQEWLAYAAQARFDWVYIRADLITEEVLSEARRMGLRVMAYTVNQVGTLRGMNVDGIMTDHVSVLRAFSR